MELEITMKRALKVWWALLWRNILAIIASMVVGVVVGTFVGFLFSLVGGSGQALAAVGVVIGGGIGLAMSVVPVYWVLKKQQFGSFRLVLISN